MKVKILKIKDNTFVDAQILDSRAIKIILPSVTDGWRFNFNKHIKKKDFEIYVLVKDETPKTIEGCLTFEMKDKVEPYMAFVEVAPHNYGKDKEYERIAGCLIAFACRLSFMKGDEVNTGWLAFDVLEEKKEDEIKLMIIYSSKYGALKYTNTTMVIPPVGGQKLIDEYLITDYEK
jgi:hypothetical protein